MKLSTDYLTKAANDARSTAQDLLRLADDLEAAANDNISQGDVPLAGLSGAQHFAREYGPMLERMG